MMDSTIGTAGTSIPHSASNGSVASLSKSILAALWDSDPTYAAYRGPHRYDGRLPVLTRASIDRRVMRIRRDLRALDRALAARSSASQARLELGALRSLLLKELFGYVDAQEPRKSPWPPSGP